MEPVPNRAPKTRVLVTNGDLGTDASHFGEWAINTRQGMAAVRRAVDAHTKRTGKEAWAETRTNDVKLGNVQPRVLYGKKKK